MPHTLLPNLLVVRISAAGVGAAVAALVLLAQNAGDVHLVGEFDFDILGFDRVEQSLLHFDRYAYLDTSGCANDVGQVLQRDLVEAEFSRFRLVDAAAFEVQVEVEGCRRFVVATDRQHDALALTDEVHDGFHQIADDVLVLIVAGEFGEVRHLFGEFFITRYFALLVGGNGLAGGAEVLIAVVELQYILLFTHEFFVLVVNSVVCFTEGDACCIIEGEGRSFTEGEGLHYTHECPFSGYFLGVALLRFFPPSRIVEEVEPHTFVLVVGVHSACAFVLSGSPIVLALSLAHV